MRRLTSRIGRRGRPVVRSLTSATHAFLSHEANMRTLPLACALALVAAALGCKTNTNEFLLEQESRMFEDEVYALEAELDATCAEKTALQRENEDLRRQLG